MQRAWNDKSLQHVEQGYRVSSLSSLMMFNHELPHQRFHGNGSQISVMRQVLECCYDETSGVVQRRVTSLTYKDIHGCLCSKIQAIETCDSTMAGLNDHTLLQMLILCTSQRRPNCCFPSSLHASQTLLHKVSKTERHDS